MFVVLEFFKQSFIGSFVVQSPCWHKFLVSPHPLMLVPELLCLHGSFRLAPRLFTSKPGLPTSPQVLFVCVIRVFAGSNGKKSLVATGGHRVPKPCEFSPKLFMFDSTLHILVLKEHCETTELISIIIMKVNFILLEHQGYLCFVCVPLAHCMLMPEGILEAG